MVANNQIRDLRRSHELYLACHLFDRTVINPLSLSYMERWSSEGKRYAYALAAWKAQLDRGERILPGCKECGEPTETHCEACWQEYGGALVPFVCSLCMGAFHDDCEARFHILPKRRYSRRWWPWQKLTDVWQRDYSYYYYYYYD